MSKFSQSTLTFCCLVLVFLNGCNQKEDLQVPPNILFIISDDHANRTISAYGDSINYTPNIDRLAGEGAIFINSFCANSICSPSRATILTGKHNHMNGLYTNGSPWNGSQMQFPRIFKENGYEATLIGKWHLNGDPGDEYTYRKTLTGAGRQGFYYNPSFLTVNNEEITENGYSTDLITQEAIRWLNEDRDREKPFMLMVQYKAVHVPRMPEFRFLKIMKTIPFPNRPPCSMIMRTGQNMLPKQICLSGKAT